MKLTEIVRVGWLFVVVLLLTAGTARAQGVVFQDFYWDTVPPPGQSWWAYTERQLPVLAAAGVQSVWVPFPVKGAAGKDDMGYGPYDLYDLGSKDQKGTVATRFGTKDEFLRFVASAHRLGLKVYSDCVLNHAMGADYAEPNPVMAKLGWNDIPDQAAIKPSQRSPEAKPGDILRSWTEFRPKGADGKLGSGRFPRTWRDFHPNDAEPDRNPPYHEKEFGEDYAYRGDGDDYVRHSMIAWSNWFVAQTGVDGYRLDDIKGMEPDMVHDFVTGSPPGLWIVGEYLDGDPVKTSGYLQQTGSVLHLFDYPLYFAIRDMTFKPESFDMRDLLKRRLPDRARAVTFVGNHDMSRNDSVLVYNRLFAQALVLAMSGTPCVYYSDFWHTDAARRAKIVRLIHLHNRLAVGDEIVRNAAQYTLALERRGHLLAVFNSGGDDAPHTMTVQTTFGPHRRLRDWAGSASPVITDAAGQVTVTVQPFTFAYYAPADAAPEPPRPALPTSQTWEFADDLDTGRLSGTPQTVRVYVKSGEAVSASAEADGAVPLSLTAFDPSGKPVSSGSDALEFRAAVDGVYRVEIKTAAGQTAHGRLTLRY